MEHTLPLGRAIAYLPTSTLPVAAPRWLPNGLNPGFADAVGPREPVTRAGVGMDVMADVPSPESPRYPYLSLFALNRSRFGIVVASVRANRDWW